MLAALVALRAESADGTGFLANPLVEIAEQPLAADAIGRARFALAAQRDTNGAVGLKIAAEPVLAAAVERARLAGARDGLADRIDAAEAGRADEGTKRGDRASLAQRRWIDAQRRQLP